MCDTMKSRQTTQLPISPGQLRTCVLLLYFLYFTGCSSNDDVIITSQTVYAKLGQSASMVCDAKAPIKVEQIEWTRCNKSTSIGVSHRHKEPHIYDRYNGSISMWNYSTITLNQVQESDFGRYCCLLTTFPAGSLRGELQLLEDTHQETEPPEPPESPEPPKLPESQQRGLSKMVIMYISIGAVGFVVLCGITIGMLCRKKRKLRNPIHITVKTGTDGKEENEEEDMCSDEDIDDGMYLNVSKPASVD